MSRIPPITCQSPQAEETTPYGGRGASMNTPTFRSIFLGSLGAALALASGSVVATSFRLTDLGTLGGTTSIAAAINAAGQATGHSTTADGESHAFLWDGATM